MQAINLWAIVLAGGEGKRLSALTTDQFGLPVPKQFCSLHGDATLLEQTVQRALRNVPAARVTAVVAEHHRRWWRHQLRNLSADNVFVQPHQRGTLAGVLLPLLHILRRDPRAQVLVLPSDHFVADESVLDRAVSRATRSLEAGVVLLGMAPEEADPELGYIVPGLGSRGAYRVASFVEKPNERMARKLVELGAVCNSFIFLADGAALLAMIAAQSPGPVSALRDALAAADWNAGPTPALRAAYAALEDRDFSRDVLERTRDGLRVLPVPACGWSDLGNPRRLGNCLTRFPTTPRGRFTGALSFAQVVLAERFARLQPAV